MNRVASLAVILFRLFAVFAFALVLLFPAYKGVWLGYVPVILGGTFAAVCALWTSRACLSVLSERVFVFLLVAVPASMQLTLLLTLRPYPQFDGLFVYREAVEFVESARMSPMTYYPPLQTWWYACWFKLFGISYLQAQLSQLPLHALVTLMMYGIARVRLSASAREVGVASAFYPSFVGYVLVTPYYHYLYTVFVVSIAWWWLKSLEKQASSASSLAGLFAGLGALTKATQLIAPVQAFAFWLLVLVGGLHKTCTKRRFLFRNVALFVLGMALVIAPWMARNWMVFGEMVPICTSGGLVFYSANNPESNGLYNQIPDEAQITTPHAMLSHSRESAVRAKYFIYQNPLQFLRLAWLKVLHTWGSEATFAELINNRGRPLGWLEEVFSAVFLAGWSALVCLWAFSAVRVMIARRPVTPLEILCTVVILSNALVYSVFEGGDRHHLPMVPLLILLVAEQGRTGLVPSSGTQRARAA